jgi:hypothetical protein
MFINEFTFTSEQDDVRTTKQFEGHNLEVILENFEDFLRGCGFVFSGHIDIVEDGGPGLGWTASEIMKYSDSEEDQLLKQTSLDQNNHGL